MIVLLPPYPGGEPTWPEIPGHATAILPAAPDPHEAAWVAHVALAIAQVASAEPLLLVAAGEAGRLLPAVGFSQRAARRRVAGYVLIDATLPPAAQMDWPDAPVTYVGHSEAARLRGWDVLDLDPAAAVVLAAQRWT